MMVPQAGVPQASNINSLKLQTGLSADVVSKRLFDAVANPIGPPEKGTVAPVISSGSGNNKTTKKVDVKAYTTISLLEKWRMCCKRSSRIQTCHRPRSWSQVSYLTV